MNKEVAVAGSIFTKSVDITHKSKRSQEENIRLAKSEFKEDASTETTLHGVKLSPFVTIEKAISYFHDSAPRKTGAEKTLFEQTEKWLKEYLTIKQTK